MITWHRYVRYHAVENYLRMGWMPHATLADTYHGQFAVHMEWRCCCGRKRA
jgi:hypothetical protein